MKTKISHSFALLALAIAAILAENAFLQSIAINNRAHDLIVKTEINESPAQSFNLMKNAGKVALAETAVPLFPGAKRLTFDDNSSVRYRIDAPINKVASFYNQVMSATGWQLLKSSSQVMATPENFNKVMIALTENPVTKKTEAIFYHQPLGGNDILGVKQAQASETVEAAPVVEKPVQTQPQEQPVQTQPQEQPVQTQPQVGDNQNNQAVPTTNERQLFKPEEQKSGSNQNQFNNYNNAPQPSSQYNKGSEMKSMEFGRPGGMDQGQRQNQGQGPSEEDSGKMDERRLKDMKRGLSQFTRSAQMMKKNVIKTKAAINKCGVSIPEELSNALNSIDDLAKKIDAAKTADELDEVVGSIEDVGSVMQDWGPRMGDLHRLCQMLKQADRDFKQVDRSFARYQAKKNSKIDISEILAEYKTNIDNMRQALVQARELAKTDADEALSKIEDDFYGNMDNVRNSEQAINMALNINKGLRDAGAEIKKIDRDIKNLKRKKIDTAQLEELAAGFKAQVEEIKNMVKGKFDVDELVDKVETAFDSREQIFDAMQEHGLGTMQPQIKENRSLNMNINLPEAFRKQDGNEEEFNGRGREINGPNRQDIMPRF